jgi:hypothetical protein
MRVTDIVTATQHINIVQNMDIIMILKETHLQGMMSIVTVQEKYT